MVWDSTQGAYVGQAQFIPGGGDYVTFDGTQNKDCIMNIARAVESITVKSGYNKTITLQQSLDIEGNDATNGGIFLSAPSARLRGSPSAVTINMLGNSTFNWADGTLESLSISVARADDKNATANILNAGSTNHAMLGTVFHIGGQLNWKSGSVDVLQTGAASGINILSSGEFNIGAVNDGWSSGVWGVSPSGQTSYFHIQNDGTVTLKTSGTATLRGDYTTSGLTWVETGTLDLGGKAEQTTGTFELHSNGTVKVSGPNNVLNNYNGGIEGNGTIDGNLTLGYDPAQGPPPYSAPRISPGITGDDFEIDIGTLTITQSYQVFSDNATTYMEIDGAGKNDKIVVQGSYAAINGSLIIDKDPNYKPDLGSSLALITSNSLSGDFIAYSIYHNDPWWIDGPPLAGGAEKDGNNYVFYVIREGS